jgi:hypothetical protein
MVGLLTAVLNKKTHGIPTGATYIGRGSAWGNPFVMGRDGDRESVIRKFEVYARQRLVEEPDWLAPLRGRDVVCFCAPLACHGHVIQILIEDEGF